MSLDRAPEQADRFEALLDEAARLCRAHELAEAEVRCRRALALRPGDARALHQLGEVTLRAGAPGLAVALLSRAALAAPHEPAYAVTLGTALRSCGRPAQAEAALRRVMAATGITGEERGTPRLRAGLALALMDQGKIAPAISALEEAIGAAPADASLHHTLGVVQVTAGVAPAALASFRQAMALDPSSGDAHAGVLFAGHYVPGVERGGLAAARAWAARHAEPLSAAGRARPHRNDPDPGRRLRVGYVSGDLRRHPVGRILQAVLPRHDAGQVEVFCYSNHWLADDVTAALRAAAQWRSLVHLSDAAAAELIRADGIDILVDLSGHTGANRLLVAARRPAPVQAMWLGYFDTTGMSAMDYLIADHHVCPPGAERHFVERLARLPDCFLCLAPPEDGPAVAPLPALSRGYVTFGCLNNVAKITPQAGALWAEILSAVPGARLALKSVPLGDPELRQRHAHWLSACGIPPDRLILEGGSSYAEHLRAYDAVDVALDPFPYNGGATTLDALWMGVPVVALAGERFVSRMGASILRCAGLGDLVAPSAEAYVQRAVALASDLDSLAALRAGLRARVVASPLGDGAALARNLERLYRRMWRTWCEARRPAAAGAVA